MATTPQQFCLRWNNHQSNIVSVFEQLLHSEAFVDVTLAVEGMSIKAHKVVLSACSPYFQAVLASHPDKHPIIILKDVRYVDMRDLLDFMYRGEVSVDQDNLSGFLRVAESLRIKGLTEVNEKKRLDTPTSPYVVSQSLLGSPTQGVISTTSVLPNDMNPLKRPPLSPTGSFSSSKRRRGRPPKISGDESEGDASSGGLTSSVEKVESRLEGEAQAVKVEPEEFGKDEAQEDKKSVDGRVSESASSSSWDGQTKDDLHPPKEEPDHTRDSRDSPGSGGVQNSHTWTPSDYEQEELNNHHGQSSSSSPLKLDLMSHSTSLLQLPPKSVAHTQHLPPSVTDIDQLYYTKNLLEAAMLKNPYDALKNDKHLHGSILLASLRSPLKFGLQGMYGDRIIGERDLIDSSSVSPHRLPSPPKSNQSSQNSISPSRVSANNGNSKKDCNSNGNSTNSNGKGVSVPIMSYCIQDNGFKCSKCFQTFTHPSNFHRHYITVHTDRRAHKCHVCGKEFKRKDNMMSHIRSVHRPGKEGHSIFRDLSTLSPTLSRNASPLPLPLPEQLVQPVDKV